MLELRKILRNFNDYLWRKMIISACIVRRGGYSRTHTWGDRLRKLDFLDAKTPSMAFSYLPRVSSVARFAVDLTDVLDLIVVQFH